MAANFLSGILMALSAFVPALHLARKISRLELTSRRPTVIIGLGGIGGWIVRYLRFFLRILFGQEWDRYFRFLVIDTTPDEAANGVYALGAGEYRYLPAFDNARQIIYLRENPRIAAWWPHSHDKPYMPDKLTGDGTNRVRINARHALFHYINEVVSDLEEAVTEVAKERGPDGSEPTTIKFYVVGSAAGGTCSGLMIDILHLCRLIAQEAGLVTSYITGVLVLDEIFRPLGRTEATKAEFSANTAALLLELNHLYQTRTYHVDYTEELTTRELPATVNRPADMLYLIDKTNMRGRTISSLHDLTRMVAAEIALEIASPMRNQTSNALDNVHATEEVVGGQPTAFSSFALHALVYPLRQIASWCAVRLLAPVARRVLLEPEQPATTVQADALDFFQRAQIEQETASLLLERLSLNDRGEAVRAPAVLPEQVLGLPEELLLGALQGLQERARVALARARTVVRENVAPICRRFDQDIQTEIERLLRAAACGPRYVAWLLEDVVQRLSELQQRLNEEQALLQATLTAQEVELAEATNRLTQALRLSSLHPRRRARIRRQLDLAVTTFSSTASATLELEKRTQAIACQSHFLLRGRRLAGRASDLVSGWEKLLDTVEAGAAEEAAQEQAVATEYNLVYSIVDKEELPAILAQVAPALDNAEERARLAGEFWRHFDLQSPEWRLDGESALAFLEESHPAMQLFAFLVALFETALQGNELLPQLKARYGDAWDSVLRNAYENTSPFWTIDMGRFGDKLQENLQYEPALFGYEGGPGWEKSVQAILGKHVTCVSTGDPHQALLLATCHGAPLFSLRGMPKRIRAYNRMLKKWQQGQGNPTPLHLAHGWENSLLDYEPESPEPERPAATGPATDHGLVGLPSLSERITRRSAGNGLAEGGDGVGA